MYRHCGFDADPSASTLQMLTNIEMRLEESLEQVQKLPPEIWEAWEKGREKERRHDARDLKLQATKEVRTCSDPFTALFHLVRVRNVFTVKA
jgi:hypothetical protein